MASTPRPATSTLRAVLNIEPLTGFETRLSTSATENMGPIASACATADEVPNRRSPSCPVVGGEDPDTAMTSLQESMKTWIHSHDVRSAVKTAGLTQDADGVMYAKTMSVPATARPAAPLQIQSVVDHVYSALRERIL